MAGGRQEAGGRTYEAPLRQEQDVIGTTASRDKSLSS